MIVGIMVVTNLRATMVCHIIHIILGQCGRNDQHLDMCNDQSYQ